MVVAKKFSKECFDDLKIEILMPNRREKYNFRVLNDKFCFVHIRNSTLADIIRFQSKNVEAFGYGVFIVYLFMLIYG